MKMQKEWASFRLTLLLYSIVLVIPLTFYFVYSSFNTIDADTKVIRQVGWLEGATMTLAINPSNQQMVKHIDEVLQKVSVWVALNNDSKLYIGGQTLTKDLSQVTTCWSGYKQKLSSHDTDAAIKQHSLKCRDAVRNLTIIIENMVYLKQNKLINMFYWNLAIAMFLALVITYMVRSYIHIQMKKHAIHDHETELFNKKYFLAELKATCASSVRHNYPLSMLHISIDNFEKGNKTYDKKIKTDTLEIFGALIASSVRASDIACRYDENHFLILLPFTENTSILEERIRQALQKDEWMISKKIAFNFTTTQFDKKETEEAFITRTLDL